MICWLDRASFQFIVFNLSTAVVYPLNWEAVMSYEWLMGKCYSLIPITKSRSQSIPFTPSYTLCTYFTRPDWQSILFSSYDFIFENILSICFCGAFSYSVLVSAVSIIIVSVAYLCLRDLVALSARARARVCVCVCVCVCRGCPSWKCRIGRSNWTPQ